MKIRETCSFLHLEANCQVIVPFIHIKSWTFKIPLLNVLGGSSRMFDFLSLWKTIYPPIIVIFKIPFKYLWIWFFTQCYSNVQYSDSSWKQNRGAFTNQWAVMFLRLPRSFWVREDNSNPLIHMFTPYFLTVYKKIYFLTETTEKSVW